MLKYVLKYVILCSIINKLNKLNFHFQIVQVDKLCFRFISHILKT